MTVDDKIANRTVSMADRRMIAEELKHKLLPNDDLRWIATLLYDPSVPWNVIVGSPALDRHQDVFAWMWRRACECEATDRAQK